jgi:hypothetical protein
MSQVGMLNMADVSRRVTEIKNLEIRTNGAYVSASHISVRGKGNVTISNGNVTIAAGGYSGDPEAPMPFEMPPMFGNERALARHERELERHERQVEKQHQRHERELERYERQIERQQRRRNR